MNKVIRTLVVSFATAALIAGPMLMADDINAPLGTGSRSTSDGGVIGTQNWGTGGDGFKVSWNITFDGTSTYHYVYSITDATGGALSKDMSHFILQLSSNITGANFASNIFNITGATAGLPTTFSPSDPGNSNPGLPGDIYGVKFDTFTDASQPTISFDSTRQPIWGDFYTKDGVNSGNDVFAYNSGFGTQPNGSTTDFTPWIPRPDTNVAVPEPGTWLLLGSTLGLVAIGRRYRERSA